MLVELLMKTQLPYICLSVIEAQWKAYYGKAFGETEHYIFFHIWGKKLSHAYPEMTMCFILQDYHAIDQSRLRGNCDQTCKTLVLISSFQVALHSKMILLITMLKYFRRIGYSFTTFQEI